MDERLSHFYGSDNFEALDYRLVHEGVLTGIEVDARRKSWGPNFLRFGLELQDDFEGGNSFSAGVRAQVTEVNRYGAEWRRPAGRRKPAVPHRVHQPSATRRTGS